jgi:hypothetical protein
MAADAILVAHVGIILFNIFGLVAVPIGAACGWRFVHVRWWRALHLGSLAVVALQASLGRACILTLWQARLEGDTTPLPLIMGRVDRLIYWPLPLWAFALFYIVVFGYALTLFRLVPPRP